MVIFRDSFDFNRYQFTKFQYEEQIAAFKDIHKEAEDLRKSGFNTADIKKDIASMEDEKEHVIKRTERLKRKVIKSAPL